MVSLENEMQKAACEADEHSKHETHASGVAGDGSYSALRLDHDCHEVRISASLQQRVSLGSDAKPW